MKSEIIGIVEVGFLQSIIQREGNQINELIKTEDLVKELHFRLRGELLKKKYGKSNDEKELTDLHIVDSSKFNKIQFDEDCHKGEVDPARFGLDVGMMVSAWENICSNGKELKEHISQFNDRISKHLDSIRVNLGKDNDPKPPGIYITAQYHVDEVVSSDGITITNVIDKQLLINMLDINIELSNNTLEYDISRGDENPINFERGFISALKKVKEFILNKES